MTRALTAAERYFERRLKDPEYRQAFLASRQQTLQFNRIVSALRDCQQDRNWTDTELADRAEVPPEDVTDLFTMKRPDPRFSTVVALAFALHLEVVVHTSLNDEDSDLADHVPSTNNVLETVNTHRARPQAIASLPFVVAPRTGAERYFAQLLKDPEYARAVEEEWQRTSQFDQAIRTLQQSQQDRNWTDAKLAEEAELPPEDVTDLFTMKRPDPPLSTVVALAFALDYRVTLVPSERHQHASDANQEALVA